MQGVDVIVFPDNLNLNCTLLLQYSKYDTVRDLFRRIASSIETEHFRLWKVDKFRKPVSLFLSSIYSQYENANSVYIPGDIIANSDQNIISLELENKFLLLIERAPKGTQDFWFINEKPDNNRQSMRSNSKNKNNDFKSLINMLGKAKENKELIYEEEKILHIEKQISLKSKAIIQTTK